MRHRPLCVFCLFYLLLQCVLLYTGGGRDCAMPPVTSVFHGMENDKKNVTVSGILYRKEIRSDYQILYLKNNVITASKETYHEKKILIYDDSFCDLHVGNLLSVTGDARAFERAYNPGNFDMQLYYAKQKLYGSVYATRVDVTGDTIDVVGEFLGRIRIRWNQRIVDSLGKEEGGIMCAMLTGEKSVMPEETKELYQKNGVSHLLAISGLHISFLGLGVYHLLRRAGIGLWTGAVVSIGILFFYLLMIGSPVSACRAVMMLIVRIGADLCGREYDMATALSLSAVFTIQRERLYLLDAGFLLSYGAITGILLVAPAVRKILPDILSKKDSFVVSLSVQLMLFPMLLYYYYEISVYGVLINLLVLPLMAPLLCLGIGGCILGSLWTFAGKLCFLGCKGILTLISAILSFAGKLPYANLVLGQPSMPWLIIYYLCLSLLVLYGAYRCNDRKKRRMPLLLTGVVFGVLMLLQTHACKNPNKLLITFLDVGQGDSIFLQGPKGGTYLIDGGSSDVSSVAKYRILPFLQSRAVTRLDYVFVTHGDADHYSGIKELLTTESDEIELGCLLFPCGYESQEALVNLKLLAESQGVLTMELEPGMTLCEGELTIAYLQPAKKDELRDTNEASMVLDLTFGEFDALFGGDLEGEGELLLEKRLRKRDYELLKAFHHGSKNANGERLLAKLRPQRVVISAGRNNDYGHPAAEAIERFRKWTDRIYNTAQNGAIMIKTDGKTVFGGF